MKKYALFSLWFIALSIPASYMMGMHSLSLNPSHSDKLKDLAQSTSTKWTKLHFLGADCACSEQIYQSLVKRSPTKDMIEKIFVIGTNAQWVKSLKEKGFDVVESDMDSFSKTYSINAVPQLTILDDHKKILYSGCYTTKRGPASASEELTITDELKMNHSAIERPIFGCITGSLNRKKTDPLNFKY